MSCSTRCRLLGYHLRAFCASYRMQYRNCLYVLRFSIPANNLMSCGAEPPPPGYKAMLREVNMSDKDTAWSGDRTQDLSIQSPMLYHQTIALSCKIKLPCLGRIRQYMCVYLSFSDTYTFQGNPQNIQDLLSELIIFSL